MQRIKNYAYLLIPLIVYEIRRSLMVAEALESRAFGATRSPTNVYKLKPTKKDVAVSVVFLLIPLLLYFIL